MGLVFAAIAPHGKHCDHGVVQAGRARARGQDARRDGGARSPLRRGISQVTVVLTPHNIHVERGMAVVLAGTMAGTLEDGNPTFVNQAKADSFWQMLMLHGAIADGWRDDFLSYEAPTYFGMLCAAYSARD